MALATFIVSIVSLCISLLVAGWQVRCSQRINNANLQAEFTKKTFKQYMTIELPEAFSAIKFPDNKLSNIDSLQNSLNLFRQELKFLKFSDKRFYKKFKKRTQKLEDYIVVNCGKKFDNDEQGEVLENIAKKLTKIYKLINKKYQNG
jgi:hypothetical protein